MPVTTRPSLRPFLIIPSLLILLALTLTACGPSASDDPDDREREDSRTESPSQPEREESPSSSSDLGAPFGSESAPSEDRATPPPDAGSQPSVNIPGSQQELDALVEEARSRPDFCDETVNILGSKEAPPPECQTPEPAQEPAPDLGPCPPRSVTLPPPANTSAETDREALMALFNATNGETWDKSGLWGGARPISEWPGVFTDDDGRVIALGVGYNLTGGRMTGELPPELGNLVNLQELHIASSQVTGAIPPELGNLVNLRKLELSGNQLCGAIPPELGDLVNLQELSLGNNQLYGEIPPELANLVNLQWLTLVGNQLTGEIPPELENLPRLAGILIGGNGPIGCVSDSLYERFNDGTEARSAGAYPTVCDVSDDPADQEALVAFYNAIGAPTGAWWHGWLGREPMGQWHGVTTDREGRVVGLAVQDNQLAGKTIPLELVDLVNLRHLNFFHASAIGEIPPELGDLVNLQELHLDFNKLTGEIPPELGNLVNLRVLNLEFSELTGAIPPELGSLVNLQELHLGVNELTGAIPPDLGNLVNLRVLNLRDTELTGAIPPDLGNLVNLQQLSLRDTELTGAIPPELGSLVNLQQLQVSNQLCITVADRDKFPKAFERVSDCP